MDEEKERNPLYTEEYVGECFAKLLTHFLDEGVPLPELMQDLLYIVCKVLTLSYSDDTMKAKGWVLKGVDHMFNGIEEDLKDGKNESK